MRTTVEIDDELRARLLEVAARRGLKGFSPIVSEAIHRYLAGEAEREDARRRALDLRGALEASEAEALRRETHDLRSSWR